MLGHVPHWMTRVTKSRASFQFAEHGVPGVTGRVGKVESVQAGERVGDDVRAEWSGDLEADLAELQANETARGSSSRDDRVTSVGKALGLLSAFRGISPPVGVSELARRAGLPKSTAFRLLADMEKAGFVERDGQDYRLGLTLFELGSRVKFCRPNGLRDTAMPHMSRLHVQTHLNVHLAVMEGSEAVFIAKVSHGRQTLRGHLQPGARVPLTCSALGKAILAFSPPETIREVVESGLPRRTKYSIVEPPRMLRELSHVHSAGVAFEHEEASLALAGVAAPIKLEGQAVAAVSVSMTPPIAHPQRIATLVRDTALQISREHEAWSDSIW